MSQKKKNSAPQAKGINNPRVSLPSLGSPDFDVTAWYVQMMKLPRDESERRLAERKAVLEKSGQTSRKKIEHNLNLEAEKADLQIKTLQANAVAKHLEESSAELQNTLIVLQTSFNTSVDNFNKMEAEASEVGDKYKEIHKLYIAQKKRISDERQSQNKEIAAIDEKIEQQKQIVNAKHQTHQSLLEALELKKELLKSERQKRESYEAKLKENNKSALQQKLEQVKVDQEQKKELISNIEQITTATEDLLGQMNKKAIKTQDNFRKIETGVRNAASRTEILQKRVYNEKSILEQMIVAKLRPAQDQKEEENYAFGDEMIKLINIKDSHSEAKGKLNLDKEAQLAEVENLRSFQSQALNEQESADKLLETTRLYHEKLRKEKENFDQEVELQSKKEHALMEVAVLKLRSQEKKLSKYKKSLALQGIDFDDESEQSQSDDVMSSVSSVSSISGMEPIEKLAIEPVKKLSLDATLDSLRKTRSAKNKDASFP